MCIGVLMGAHDFRSFYICGFQFCKTLIQKSDKIDKVLILCLYLILAKTQNHYEHYILNTIKYICRKVGLAFQGFAVEKRKISYDTLFFFTALKYNSTSVVLEPKL